MRTRHSLRQSPPPRRAVRYWAAVSTLALVAFAIELDSAAPAARHDGAASRVVPALK